MTMTGPTHPMERVNSGTTYSEIGSPLEAVDDGKEIPNEEIEESSNKKATEQEQHLMLMDESLSGEPKEENELKELPEYDLKEAPPNLAESSDDEEVEESGNTPGPYFNEAMAELLVSRKEQKATLSSEELEEASSPFSTTLRKVGVAVAGGSMIVVGAVLVPCPLPLGILTMAAGMGVLGTEFPEAQRTLDGARDSLAAFAETKADATSDYDESCDEQVEDATSTASDADDEEDTLGNDETILAALITLEDVAVTMEEAAQSLRRQAFKLKESVLQPLAGKTVAAYDQMYSATSEMNSFSFQQQERVEKSDVGATPDEMACSETSSSLAGGTWEIIKATSNDVIDESIDTSAC